MTTRKTVIVHSVLGQDGAVTHLVQSNDPFRFQQAQRALKDYGFEEVQDSYRYERGFQGVEFWSWQDRTYTAVPPRDHSRVLKLIGLPANKVDLRSPALFSTTVFTKASLKHKRSRPSSPVPFALRSKKA